MEIKEAQKRSFLEELYELDDSDDSVNDIGSLLANLRAAKPVRKSRTSSQGLNRRRADHAQRQILRLLRTVSAPSGSTSKGFSVSPIEPSPTDGEHHPGAAAALNPRSPVIEEPALHFQTAAASPNTTALLEMAPGAKGKRKRGQALEVLPEAQQIFRGLRFYFLPNDDVAPARRLRINKVLERGAIWAKQWDDDITHVIVDMSLTYKDLLRYLKKSSIPSNIAVVNEHYPAECIHYRSLVNPDQTLYHIKGHPQKVEAEQEKSINNSSVASLPLKPEKHANPEPSPTPTRTEASEQLSVDQRAVVNTTTHSLPKETHAPFRTIRNQPPDGLDKAIEEMLAVKDLPLDDEDVDSPTTSTPIDESDDDDNREKPDRIKAKKTSFKNSWQSKFTCMDKHTGTENQANPNARTIEVLKQMTDYYDRTNDHWRTIAYRKAIAALKKQTQRIITKEEAFAIPFIGERLAIKIEEIVFTNRLRRLENTNFDATDAALQLFLKIYGVGHSQASQWINQGYRTLTDLTTKASLTKNQQIGIEHIDDFATRIKRAEVEHHGQIVRDAIAREDPAIEATIGGSYRRGATDSGDVDFIITKPDCSMETLRTIILDIVIPNLFTSNYLQHALAVTSRSEGSKWHGCAILPNSKIWHRIDFLLVPHEEIGTALIYFTGNDIFNRSIRLLASRKGMRLNQRGLWKDVMRGKSRERITQGELVESRDEKKVFEHLESRLISEDKRI
ncbi:MAG: hypothetical protein Q9166_001903 [cf. Caloplaca sp. 2 TL-2023]